MLVPPQSLHLLLSGLRLCWQMLVTPQSLQSRLRRSCGQMLVPPQSLHVLHTCLCAQMLPPPQSSESTHLWRRRPCGDVFLTARGAVGSSLRPCRLLRRRPVPSLLLQVK